ncbi:S-adenosylmethionine decarboxylase [Striga asiatica]|uniref:S-adenosylmethionine decarboxylase n=1 Tax=Striga asiatica TaxID=4170 RepID=A0A5A7Q6W6_STRAF|nr:S-adenosylmethionine decarboxylase [Striga asiatica]
MARRIIHGLQLEYDFLLESTVFTIEFLHGGLMMHIPMKEYRGGYLDYFDGVDGEMFGLIELKDFIEQLGYNSDHVNAWHVHGISLQDGSHIIDSDQLAYKVMNLIPENRIARIVLEHVHHGIFEEEHDLELGDSDSFESVRGSDEEDNVVKFLKYNP